MRDIYNSPSGFPSLLLLPPFLGLSDSPSLLVSPWLSLFSLSFLSSLLSSLPSSSDKWGPHQDPIRTPLRTPFLETSSSVTSLFRFFSSHVPPLNLLPLPLPTSRIPTFFLIINGPLRGPFIILFIIHPRNTSPFFGFFSMGSSQNGVLPFFGGPHFFQKIS